MEISKFFKNKRFVNAAYKYISGLLVYGIPLLIYINFPFYQNFLQPLTIQIMVYLYFAYVFLAFPVCYLAKDCTSKPLEIVLIFNRAPDLIKSYSYSFLKKSKKTDSLTEREKIVLRFGLVKYFYIPLMLNFTVSNINVFKNSLSLDYLKLLFTDFNGHYIIVTQLFFAIDTFIFCLGYILESKYLKNTLRSVEPTLIGWMVALAAYPPFNATTTTIIGGTSSDVFAFPIVWLDSLMKLGVVILLGNYLWATLSLGFKASNLTNRGIVTHGAYKYMRHPAYISKVSAWWIMMFANFSILGFITMLSWSMIYYLRAVTEERHLIADPEYQAYIKKTPYRFIPGII